MSGYLDLDGMDAWGMGSPGRSAYKPDDFWGSVMPGLNNNAYSGDGGGMLDFGVGKLATAGGALKPDFFSWDSFLGGKGTDGFQTMGWGPALFNVGKSIFDGWMGMQKLDLAKDSLNFQKDAFSKQFENQRSLTNSQLQDRQAARVAADPRGYQAVDEYMRQNRV